MINIDSTSDLVVVGGGIVGLATALRLLEARPSLRLTLLEKEPELATHQTGRNSGVIHSPNTYEPGSLKARLCAEGMRDAIRFAEEHGVPYERCGELIVATTEEELPRLARIAERARANGVEVRELEPEAMREIESHVVGLRALHVPSTGIIDWRRFAFAIADEVRARGGTIVTSAGVQKIVRKNDGAIVESTAGTILAQEVISCAGLHSDRLAAMTGDRGDLRIVPFRGDYAVLRPEARGLCRTLIYPVPDPRFPFLGVHLTRRIDGEVWAGPNAVLALGREAYRRRDIDPREVASLLGYPGFVRFAARYWGMAMAEIVRDFSRHLFAQALQRYTPEITASDLRWGPSGIRAQAMQADGTLVHDFKLRLSERTLHVMNAPSPAATAGLAIGRHVAGISLGRLEPHRAQHTARSSSGLPLSRSESRA